MFCPNCGMQIDDNAVFCGECGANIAEANPIAQPSSAPAAPDPSYPEAAYEPSYQPQGAQAQQPFMQQMQPDTAPVQNVPDYASTQQQAFASPQPPVSNVAVASQRSRIELEEPDTPTPRLKRSDKSRRKFPKVAIIIPAILVAAGVTAFAILPAVGVDVPGYINELVNPTPPPGADDEYLATVQDVLADTKVVLEEGNEIAADFDAALGKYAEDGNTTKYVRSLEQTSSNVADEREVIAGLIETVEAGNPRTDEGKSAKESTLALLHDIDGAFVDLDEMAVFENAEVQEIEAIVDATNQADQTNDIEEYVSIILEATSNAQENMGALYTPDCLSELWSKYTQSLDTFKYGMAYLYFGVSNDNVLDYYTGSELIDWFAITNNRYAGEISNVMGKQLDQSQRMFSSNYMKRHSEIAAACERGVVVPEASTAPHASIDYTIVDEIYPNMYPSMDSIINIYAVTDQPEQEVIVTAQIEGFTQKFEEKRVLTTKQSYIMVHPAALVDLPDLGETWTTQVNLTITDAETGKVLAQESDPITIHSLYDFKIYDEEMGTAVVFNIMGWLRPESPEVAAINRKAVDYLEKTLDGSLPGYQDGYGFISKYGDFGYDLTTLVQVCAIQKAISDYGVRYTMDAYTYEDDEQRVLTADEVVKQKTGICIESSVLMASCLTKAGFHTMIILIPGHAQVAVESWNGSNQYYLIETTDIPYDGFSISKNGELQTNGLVVTSVISAQEWENYLAQQENYAQNYGGFVYVIDCQMISLMGIRGLENA